MYIGTRTGTKQAMVPESSRGNFAVAKSHVTMNATANLESITANILSLLRKPLKIRQDANTTSLPDLKVKTRSVGGAKYPSPRRRDRMICAIHCCQVAEQLNLSNLSQHILPYDEPNLYNDFITKEIKYKDRFIINFPCHCVLGHVLSDSNPLDNLGPWKEVV